MTTIVGILTFINRINLSMNSGPGPVLFSFFLSLIFPEMLGHKSMFVYVFLCYLICHIYDPKCNKSYFVVFVFNVPPTAKVIWERGHGLKSHPTD